MGEANDDGERFTESEVSAIYASTVVIGIGMCIFLDVYFHKSHGSSTVSDDKEMSELAIENGTKKVDKEEPAEPVVVASFFDISNVQPIAWEIIWGDFFHNFTDGIVIGAAFMSCDTSAGWTVTAGTVYHEIAQEVADFMVLTSEGRMTFAQAAFGNFVSALGILIGCIVTTESDPSSPVLGALMVYGAAFYVYIALAQLQWWTTDKQDLLRNAGIFLFGCASIGLVLIAHEHCSPAGSDGHDHHHH